MPYNMKGMPSRVVDPVTGKSYRVRPHGVTAEGGEIVELVEEPYGTVASRPRRGEYGATSQGEWASARDRGAESPWSSLFRDASEHTQSDDLKDIFGDLVDER